MEARIFECCICLIILLISHPIEAADYIVGDDEQWTTTVNYQPWSKKYNFTVGDTLVFRYVPDQHNVFEVSQETYRSCNTSTGVIATYYSGYDRVKLSDARKYWFLCNIQDHCRVGMRFGIEVQASTDMNDTDNGYTPTSKTTNAIGHWDWVWSCYLAALVGPFMLGY